MEDMGRVLSFIWGFRGFFGGGGVGLSFEGWVDIG